MALGPCRKSWPVATAALLAAFLAPLAASGPAKDPPQVVRLEPPRLLPLRATWTADLPSEPAAPPTASGSRVFVPLNGGGLVALSPVSGEMIWAADIQTHWPVATDGTRVFAAVPGALSAVFAEDGAPAWRATYGDLTAPFTARGGWLIAGVAPTELVALRASDGTEVWRRDVGAPLAAAPAVAGDRVYVTLRDGRILAMHIEHGERIWERSMGGTPGGVLALEDRVFVGDSDNFLYCLAPRDGEMRWRWRTGADVVMPAAADEQRVYFVSLDNVIRALDRRTGAQRWRQTLPGRALGGPQVAAGVVLVATAANRLSLFGAESGAMAAIDLPAPAVEAPTEPEASAAGGRLFVVTVDGTGRVRVQAFETGHEPALIDLARLPGRPLWPEIPLATRALPVGLLPLPAPPPRGG